MHKVYHDLKKVINNTLSNLSDKMIIQAGNAYVLYNRYAIVKQNGAFSVFRRSDDLHLKFGTIKHAVAWAILDKYNRLREANRVYELDQLLESVKVDKQIHERLKKKGNMEQYLIQNNKLQLDIERQKRFIAEMHKYITSADNCYQRGIKNELNGTEWQ